MTVSVSPDLEQAVRERASHLHLSVDALVHQALTWYLQSSPELLDEMAAWQEIGEEAIQLVEDSLR